MLAEPQTIRFSVPNFGQPESSHSLVCYQWGDIAAERTVICVHALTRNGRDFDFLAQALSADFRVLCPDMPGRGKSDWLADPKGYNYPAYVADMLYVLSHLNLPRVHWVGTSMGGIIGMMAANMRPGLIDALVLNDIGAVVSADGLKRITQYAGKAPVFAIRAEAEATLRERCAPFGIRDESHWQQLFAHSFQENPDGTLRFACDPNILAGIAPTDIAQDIDLWALWEAVSKIPLLVVHGVESDILIDKTVMEMQVRHPNFTLKDIPNTGHAPALMADDQTQFIRQWLLSAAR